MRVYVISRGSFSSAPSVPLPAGLFMIAGTGLWSELYRG